MAWRGVTPGGWGAGFTAQLFLEAAEEARWPAVSVLLRANGRLSDADADVERARLLHQYALHRASADAQRLADLQYANQTANRPLR
jgi:hypothetical protein